MGALATKLDSSFDRPPAGSVADKVLTGVLTYETVQVTKVRSLTLALLHNSIRFAILTYVIVVVFWQQNGYQLTEEGVGSTQVDVRGVSFTQWHEADSDNLDVVKGEGIPLDMRVSDVGDLVFPAKEEGALFLTTNYLDTPTQRRSVCESGHKADACESDDDCPKYEPSRSAQGYYNGICDTKETNTCMLIAWCPTAADPDQSPNENVLPSVSAFILKTRATIKFPFHGEVTSNTRHGRGEVPGLNLFKVSEILNATNTTFEEVAQDGAVFSISFTWDCNLDIDVDECDPDVQFSRLDDPNAEDKGFSFPYTTYSSDAEQGIQFRYLRQAYGLRFLIESTGRGRRFDWATIVVKLGSTAALIGLATVFVDFLSLYILPKKEVYNRAKYNHFHEAEEVHKLNREKTSNLLSSPTSKQGSKQGDGDCRVGVPSSYGTVPPSLSDAEDGSAKKRRWWMS